MAYVTNYVSNAREGGKRVGRWGGSVGRWVSARRLRGRYVGTGIGSSVWTFAVSASCVGTGDKVRSAFKVVYWCYTTYALRQPVLAAANDSSEDPLACAADPFMQVPLL